MIPLPHEVVRFAAELNQEAERARRRREREREQETEDHPEQEENPPTGPAMMNGPL